MEEVDKIIIHILKNVGCDLDEDVSSIKQFSEELIVDATVRCIELIKPGTGLPRKLPPSMSLRLRAATLIAQAVKDLGFRGDMGYQTLLYFNETDIRRMFMFLIEALPRDTDKSIQSKVKNQFELLEADIASAIQTSMQAEWSSPFEKKLVRSYPFRSVDLSIPDTSSSSVSYEKKEYWARYLRPVTEQCPPSKLIPSLIVFNAGNEVAEEKRSEFLRAIDIECSEMEIHAVESTTDFVSSEIRTVEIEKSNIASDSTSGEVVEIVDRTREVTENIEKLKSEIEEIESNLKISIAKESQTIEKIRIEEQAIEKRAKETQVRSKVQTLIAEKSVTVAKLNEMSEANVARLIDAAMRWDKHRASLIEEYRNVRENRQRIQSEVSSYEERLAREIQKFQEYSNEAAMKRSLCERLRENCSKLSDTVNRSAYTRRIMEIIGNIWKQSAEIDKVLADMKVLQKDINTLNGKLDRSFMLADESIFNDAKHEETSRRAYKLLATLHSDCSELSQLAMQIGSIVRETRDLQEQLETEQSRNTVEQLKRVTDDLNQIRQEIQTQKNIKLQREMKSKA